MLPANPFLGGFGPSIDETGIRPEGPGLSAIEQMLSQRDQDEAMRAALEQHFRQLQTEGTMTGMRVGAQLGGQALRPVLRPLAQSARTAIARTLGYAQSSPVPTGARAVNGAGNVLFSAATPASSALETDAAAAAIGQSPEAIEAAGQTAPTGASAAGDGASLLGSLGKLLGVAGVGYSAYQGLQSGHETLHGLSQAERAFRNGELDQDAIDAQRDAAFRSGMIHMGLGGATGILGGASLGPIGAVAGGVAGGSGGALTATRAYNESDHPAEDTWKASLRFAANPFRKR